MVATSAIGLTQMAPKSLEELSRHLRRERLKLERNLSDDTCESQQLVQKDDAQKQKPATGDTAVEGLIVLSTGVNNSLDESATITGTKIDSAKKADYSNENSANNMKDSKSSSSKSVSSSTLNGGDSSMTSTDCIQPNNGSTPKKLKAAGKLGLPSAWQVKQRYAKLKSRQPKPRVSSDDDWLIRQTPNLSGSGPDDEVSVYPDTISVMSVETVIRSNILIVEEVITEEGRTCYMI